MPNISASRPVLLTLTVVLACKQPREYVPIRDAGAVGATGAPGANRVANGLAPSAKAN
jgi:hypothetical protein